MIQKVYGVSIVLQSNNEAVDLWLFIDKATANEFIEEMIVAKGNFYLDEKVKTETFEKELLLSKEEVACINEYNHSTNGTIEHMFQPFIENKNFLLEQKSLGLAVLEG